MYAESDFPYAIFKSSMINHLFQPNYFYFYHGSQVPLLTYMQESEFEMDSSASFFYKWDVELDEL